MKSKTLPVNKTLSHTLSLPPSLPRPPSPSVQREPVPKKRRHIFKNIQFKNNPSQYKYFNYLSQGQAYARGEVSGAATSPGEGQKKKGILYNTDFPYTVYM